MSTDSTRIKGLCNASCQAMGSYIKSTCFSIYENILYVVLLTLFSGPAIICEALVFAADRNKLMQEYLERGIRVKGTVRRHWITVETGLNEKPRALEKAIVSYEAPTDGNHYQMNLIPLAGMTKIEITETRMVQVLILYDYPTSGYPLSYINPHADGLGFFIIRFLLFLLGCAFVVGWTWVPVLYFAQDNTTPHLVLIIILVAVGVNFIFTIIVLLAFWSSNRNEILNFSKKMEGQSIDMTSPLINMTSTQLHDPLVNMHQMLHRVSFPCINCMSRSNDESMQE